MGGILPDGATAWHQFKEGQPLVRAAICRLGEHLTGQLLLLLELNEANRINRFQTSDGTCTVGCRQYLTSTIDNEIRRLNDMSTFFPPGPQYLGLLPGHAIGDGICKVFRRVRNLLYWFSCRRDNLGAQCFQFGQVLLETV